jgi:hypothetical protein
MHSFGILLDRLPESTELHRALTGLYRVPPDGVYVGRLFADGGGPPATVYCGFIDTDGGEFLWRLEISTDATVIDPDDSVVAAVLARQLGVRTLLPVETADGGERWRLITADEDQWVDLDLDELDEERYVVAGPSR